MWTEVSTFWYTCLKHWWQGFFMLQLMSTWTRHWKAQVSAVNSKTKEQGNKDGESLTWYAGIIVMTSFYYAIISGNWFQTNQPEHELDDCSLLLCVLVLPMRKIWQTKITDETGILVLVRVFWDVISKIYWKRWHSLFNNTLESSYNFCPIEIVWRKMASSVHLKPMSMATWRLHALGQWKSISNFQLLDRHLTWIFPKNFIILCKK